MQQERTSTRQRPSLAIRGRPAINLHHATRFADVCNLTPNIFVTINFDLLGVQPRSASSLLRKLIAQRFAPWLRRTLKQSLSYVWTIEAAGGLTAAHWLVSVPFQNITDFEQKLNGWLCELTAHEPEVGAIDVRPIKNLVGLRRYMLKGIDPAWASHLGVTAIPQGETFGKRLGFSRNLGPTARKKAGYKPRQRVVVYN